MLDSEYLIPGPETPSIVRRFIKNMLHLTKSFLLKKSLNIQITPQILILSLVVVSRLLPKSYSLLLKEISISHFMQFIWNFNAVDQTILFYKLNLITLEVILNLIVRIRLPQKINSVDCLFAIVKQLLHIANIFS